MQSKMAKSLPYLFSTAIGLSLLGCLGSCPAPVIMINSPELEYPKTTLLDEFNITARRSGQDITMSEKQFKLITDRLVEQKYMIKTLQSIIDSGNNWYPISTSEEAYISE